MLPRSASRSATGTDVVVLDDASHLHDYLPHWEDLARNAIEPNVFYEPWMLLPALRAFGAGEDLLFALVLERDAQDPAPLDPSRLLGFFPLQRRRHYRRMPVPMLCLWRHVHCFLCTPLVRASRARECLAAFLAWLERDSPAPMIEWGWIAADGPFHHALARALDEAGRPVFEAERHTRGLLRRRSSADAYLAEALAGSSRKELRRQERRLAELGELRYDARPAADAPRWIEQFLALEASGWKGERGSALGSSPAALDFFRSAAGEGARRGRLEMLGLLVSGRPIALKCNFVAQGGGAFAFKIAYDEAFRRYSPGMLLELENIRRFHAASGAGAAEWMDSCADPDHFMVNRLWLDRRSMLTRITATGRAPGDLMVSALPLMRWLYRRAKSAAAG